MKYKIFFAALTKAKSFLFAALENYFCLKPVGGAKQKLFGIQKQRNSNHQSVLGQWPMAMHSLYLFGIIPLCREILAGR